MELTRIEDVAAASGDDIMVMWAAQGLRGGVRAWALGGAVAVASPDLNRRDRLTVCGPAPEAAKLVRLALPELGPDYRLTGERSLVEEVVRRLPGARVLGSFEWMDTGRDGGAVQESAVQESAVQESAVQESAVQERIGGDEGVGWLPPGADGEVTELLAEASPSAWAVPGLPGIRRWAGVREGGGLVATAADAWSSPQVGFIAGVATAPAFRGRGLGEAVCRFAIAELAAAHGRVALVVDTDNLSAIRVYERLGMRIVPVAAAALTPS
ncbi:GNAT family N-acetyltransferase [Planobispora siamensis]|uniref:N-acetyltransferase domain-containing protein n=1 Tax=Planobispora siamensis TaxID=936338 RepID=A0A8J3SR52_9ACTN|nr:GNAT family N-acetyltransferase [Planobispora siamensis]GIH96879.1 hypothetical protein Psi01_75090 [Planobispora siamensis]